MLLPTNNHQPMLLQHTRPVVFSPPQALTSCTAGTTGCTSCSTCGGTPQVKNSWNLSPRTSTILRISPWLAGAEGRMQGRGWLLRHASYKAAALPEPCSCSQGGFGYVISNGGLATNGTYPFVGFTTSQRYPKTSTASCDTSLEKKVR